MGRTNCGICTELLQRDQPTTCCPKCNNLFHSSCVNDTSNNSQWICNDCTSLPSQTSTDDKFNLILQELKSIKSNQSKSDEALKVISSSVKALNDRVSGQAKTMTSLSQAMNTLNGNLNTVTSDVKSQGAIIGGLNTRIAAVEKNLSETVHCPPPTTTPLALNDITHEIQLRSRCAVHIIIRGVPESSVNTSASSSSADKTFVKEMLDKLEPKLPETVIRKVFRVGKIINDKPRLLKVELTSQEEVNHVVISFLRLRSNIPDGYSQVSITRDRTPSERRSIYEVHQELRDRQEKGESNISIRYFNGLPKIVPARTNISHQSKNSEK
ncbi:unnamed protein product [Macrosiphum euphorbiae]|uniref:PHD-type domain-containing protein n=1 Tax=Macrosiphum euphorbiae TaxID=13131 RepID=A0AAV0Y041_9HEMI|nr:unnamed protein product [Macrosiphum euphorbiae]